MSNFIQELMNSVGPQVSEQISRNVGVPKEKANQLLPQIAPLILGGLKKQMENHGGPERVDHILNKYGSDRVLDDIPGLIQSKLNDDQADPRLGGLLGDSGVQAAQMLSNQFQLDGATAQKLIPMLAPIVLGALTRKRDREEAGTLGIAGILDQDGDGSILDDVAGFFMNNLMGGSSAATKKAGSLFGSLFGALLGKRN